MELCLSWWDWQMGGYEVQCRSGWLIVIGVLIASQLVELRRSRRDISTLLDWVSVAGRKRKRGRTLLR